MKKWLIIFLFATLMGLMNLGIVITEKMAYGESIPFQYPFVHEMTGTYTVLLLLPFLLWFFKKFPIRRKNLLTRIPLHLLVSVVFGVCHTMLMALSRILIYWLANMGVYDQGQIIYRLLMEYQKQFFMYWLIYGIVLFVDSLRKSQEQKLKTARLEQELTRARLQALQMQLNPHFLFNTLNMISSTMYRNVSAADKMIAYLSDLLRITLKSRSSEEYTLEKELEVLSLYIEIMKARFRDKLVVHTDISPHTQQALVPGFILQPLVENSIKHSMETLEKVEIKITSRIENNRLILIVRDNGPGIPGEPDQALNNGVGLANTVERLEKLYGNNHQFHLENIHDRGFQVVIEIPFRTTAPANSQEAEN